MENIRNRELDPREIVARPEECHTLLGSLVQAKAVQELSELGCDSSTAQGESARVERPIAVGHLQLVSATKGKEKEQQTFYLIHFLAKSNYEPMLARVIPVSRETL